MGRRTLGKPKASRQIERVEIESVDLEGQGVARIDGRVAFVQGALAGECVDLEVLRERPSYIKGRAIRWHRESADRVTPRCKHFGVCGGCSLQHASGVAQIAIKQRALEDVLWHIGRLRPETVLSPMRGPDFGYRMRARLSVRWVDKKGGLLVGFRERSSSYVAQMDSCEVLPPGISATLPALRDCIASLTIAREIPQVELAAGDDKIIWVLRHLAPLGAGDADRLLAFGHEHQVEWWLQPAGPASIHPLDPSVVGRPGGQGALHYRLPEFGLEMPFSPVEFTQVNFAINQRLVSLALRLLDPQPDDCVVDFFCGLGNFTLPLARKARKVIGLEGSRALTDQAMANGALHCLESRLAFDCLNLFEVDRAWLDALGPVDRALIDPPREGAQAVCEALAEQSLDNCGPHRMVMVSCNPATLARDAAILVHKGCWVLKAAGVVNMFPQTAHVESLALFERLPPGAVRPQQLLALAAKERGDEQQQVAEDVVDAHVDSEGG